MVNIIETMKRVRTEHKGSVARIRYAEAVRRAAVRHWLNERSRGRLSREVAAELGVHEVSLWTWRRKYESGAVATSAKARTLPAIREVVLQESVPASAKVAFVVHASCSVRIEGMSMTEVIALLRGLQ